MTVVGDRGLRSTDYESYACLVDQRDAEDRDEDFVQIARLGLPFWGRQGWPNGHAATSTLGDVGSIPARATERQSNNSRVTMVHNYLYATNETHYTPVYTHTIDLHQHMHYTHTVVLH